MVKITVDGKQIEAKAGKSVLQACLENGIYVPNLCFMKGMDEPTGSCRLCFVEIEGQEKLSPSCKTKVAPGMVVKTDTAPVRQIQKVVFGLLFSAHHMACKACAVKKSCELQKIAKFLGVRLKANKDMASKCEIATKLSHPSLDLLPAKCILCRKCLYVCKDRNEKAVLTLVKNANGADPAIGFAGEPGQPIPCGECRACVEVCPVSAIVPKESNAGTAETAQSE
jgi:NADH dehydrogenase/NADH:ubiquinone oxidoreductase subunit G